MTTLAHGGVSIDLPDGWDAQIRLTTATAPADAPVAAGTVAAAAEGPAATVLHAASFALPAERGDYGSGAVDAMGGSDILICLLEHEREAAATALFAHEGLPVLTPALFSPQSMQRAVAGMCGAQRFFRVDGRPFCLYVVLGSWRTRAPLARTADRVVRTVRFTG